ncbi:embryonic polarity protein dorsal-like isoform X2 [Bacillus rossius redtenbacheri]
MEHDDSGQPDLKLSDVIEVIETDQEQSSGVRGMYGGGGPGTAMDDARLRAASVKIVEQPASKALRFRYECEGRSAGSIPGKHSTPENKTFPSIQVVGYKGRALVVVSCVTKDPPYRPHPHNLVGKEGCKMGVCTLEINQETMAATFSNLGIQCVKKKDIEEALKTREEIGVDPFKTGFQHRSQTTSIDLNAVRLCFQVFLEGNHRGKFNYQLPPVVSEPIYDKKAMSDLVICRLSDCSCTVAGGREIILLCEKVAKEDIEIRFFEGNENKPVWEARGDFQPTNVHKQVAIAFRTPRYRTLETDAPVKAFVQLRRPSDGATSEPLPFEFLPLDSGRPAFWSLRRALAKKGDYTIFSSILATNSALLTRVGPKAQAASAPSKQSSATPHVSFADLPKVDKSPFLKNSDMSKSGIEEKTPTDDDVIVVGDVPASQELKETPLENLYDYSEVKKWTKTQSEFEVDDNANIESLTSLEKKTDEPGLAQQGENVDVIMSDSETCNSLNELLTQVAELDEIYSDTRARLMNPDIGKVSPSVDVVSHSPEDVEMAIDEYFDDSQTYSSLQLAMKNPVEPTGYEDVTPPAPFISVSQTAPSVPPHLTTKRENTVLPDSPDSKLPPLPPKRVRKSPPTPPARPEHLLSYEPPPSPQPVKSVTQAPSKDLPDTPAVTAKPPKPSLFQKLFSKKGKSGKRDKSGTPRSGVSREGSIGNLSTAESVQDKDEVVVAVTPPSPTQPDATEAEHYALYTDMAPHATASEFDETSFYYSPVEGGRILATGEESRIILPTKNRDIYT